ncbi:1A family penicillin-binding protein [Hasllibacter halocynthiae]|uniref:peptidoglycan glycosyltransferase n=1 Tax=Hasllibacter halocynthiae TaxID=595589 RepID=A0A2T0X1W4_9RHOB|nr:PBP1A family penicillin-binding protein [Hasllibacter halocynthiae]PRY92930.1 1A family penicillin-binding protein [Hasllibacter halocynthiae]
MATSGGGGGRRLRAERRTPPKGRGRPAKAAPKRKARRPRRSRSLLRRAITLPFRALWAFAWRLSLVGAAVLAAMVAWTAIRLPPAAEMFDGRARGSVTLLDRHGEPFAWRGDQYSPVTVDSVSPLLRDAVVATEDRRFFSHLGVSPRGVAGAMRINMREGRGPLQGHGGSTITQQTAKLLCLGTPYDPAEWESEAAYEADCRRTTLARKAFEAIYAMAMELRYSKEEILTIYLNRAYLGAGARGFEAASQRYFGHGAEQVGAAEAAMLAGLLVAPSRYDPTRNLERSRERAETVLRLMHEQGYLSQAEHDAARADPATLAPRARQSTGGYFADWVMASGPEFFMEDTTADVMARTTFDPAIQAAAERAVETVFAEQVREGSEAEAAVVVMSADGAVRAMVGGRDLDATGAFNRATMARRQPGSAFKPFVYAAALDLGYPANSTVVDEPITIRVPGSGAYTPRNYDGRFHGRVTLTEALARSYNIPAVRVFEEVGREAVAQIANDFGLDTDLAQGPAVALGASETTLISITGAYAGILNGGRSVTPYGLVTLSTRADGTVMEQTGGMGERVISMDAAEQLVWMMSRVVEDGTGARAALPGGQPVAGKTGTTQEGRDAWFVGFSADYAAGVWMGYDDNRPLTGVTGGGLPADIFREAMAGVHAGDPPRALPMRTPEAARAPGPVPGTAPTPVPGLASQPLPVPQPDRTVARSPEGGNAVERALIEVLGEILGE